MEGVLSVLLSWPPTPAARAHRRGQLCEVLEPSMHNITVLLTEFLSAWVIHISLWVFSLIPISTHNINNSLPCTGWRNAQESGDYELLKNIFVILLYGEFLLFSLFGLVLPFTFLKHVIKGKYNVSYVNLEDLWNEQDGYYNILNIFSKTLLFLLCGFFDRYCASQIQPLALSLEPPHQLQ